MQLGPIMLNLKSIIHNKIARTSLTEKKDETINHIVSECNKLAQEYKARWKVIDRELNQKLKLDHTTKGYMHKPESVLENKMRRIFCNFEIQTDHLIPNRKSDWK